MTTPTSDFYLTLPSNASTSMYPKNGPSGFKVALPNVYELHGDEWQVGLGEHVGEHARFHRRIIERVSAPRGVLCPDIQSKKTRQVQRSDQVPRRPLGCIARGTGSLSNVGRLFERHTSSTSRRVWRRVG